MWKGSLIVSPNIRWSILFSLSCITACGWPILFTLSWIFCLLVYWLDMLRISLVLSSI